MRKLRNVNIIT